MCGNTGIVNRGCEAIIRSTVSLISQKNNSIYLASDDYGVDANLAKELGLVFVPYNQPNMIQRLTNRILKVFNDKTIYMQRINQAHLLSLIKPGDMCFNIGGDTYCYGRPSRAIALNRLAKIKGAKTCLWCCSIEESSINDEVKEDLDGYDYIFVREKLSKENLLNKGINPNKVVKVCDPAFFLKAKKINLPHVFSKGDTIGINVSELIIKDNNNVHNAMLGLIKFVLSNTNYNVCLIPHVYDIEKNICDWPLINELYNEIDDPRVGIIDKSLSCEELKYVISHCRFMIAARTHASIAAYSSGVPTIVLGYSVKSKGIATDLFGDFKHYVIPYDEIVDESILIEEFDFLQNNENDIRNRLKEYIPVYRNELLSALELIVKGEFRDNYVCDTQLCCGCLACKNSCPVEAIESYEDEYGFIYPKIKPDKCINCGLCMNVCPVNGIKKDDIKLPNCYAALNNDIDIRLNSSSGGVFYLIAKYILDQDGVVFGASFDSNYNVVHTGIFCVDDIRKLQGSKYVQSNLLETYKEAQYYLEIGKKVLFSGTPCQIEGLKFFLKIDYDNLFTQDLICNGVPSPRAWHEYIAYIERTNNSRISEVSFRNKTTGWNTASFMVLLDSGNKVSNLLSQDLFFQRYIQGFYTRNSCHNCLFKKNHRISDITIGDFWGIESIDESMDDKNGTSLVLINSSKGSMLFNEIMPNLICKSVNPTVALKYNSAYYVSSKPHMLKRPFYKMWKRKGFVKASKYYEKWSHNRIYMAFKSIVNWSWKQ